MKVVGDALHRDDVESVLMVSRSYFRRLALQQIWKPWLGPVRLFSASTRILVPAMERAGIRRLICVTGFGAGDSRERLGCLQSIPFRLLLERAYDDKDIQERIIRESALDWVIVRPVLLTNGSRTGRYQVLEDSRCWRGGLISRADVADFLIKNVEHRVYVGKTPVLAY